MTSQRGIIAAPVMDEALGFSALASETKVVFLQMNQSSTKRHKKPLWQDWCVLSCADWVPLTFCIMTSQRGLTVREGAFGVLIPTNNGVSFWISNERKVGAQGTRNAPRWYDSGILVFPLPIEQNWYSLEWAIQIVRLLATMRQVACQALSRPRPSEVTWFCKANVNRKKMKITVQVPNPRHWTIRKIILLAFLDTLLRRSDLWYYTAD